MSRLAAVIFSIGAVVAAAGADEPGIAVFPGATLDSLLTLGESEIEVILITAKLRNPKELTQAHIDGVRGWIETGGILWAEGTGLDNRLVQELVSFEMTPYKYVNSAMKPDGQVIVRSAKSRNVIHEHIVTEGVETLFIVPTVRFNGTKGMKPIVSMTDGSGQYGVVITSIPIGSGFVVLDGTARKDRGPAYGRITGFDPAYPNTRTENGTPNSYDWSLLQQNALSFASVTLPQGNSR